MFTIGVTLALFFLSFNCNINSTLSSKNDNVEAKKFISLPTNTFDQRQCSCAMPNSCSCCEYVKIFYTGDEKRLCFNMIYQRNGLNFDLSLDNTIIKSMTVANYRPFRMCASVPGLLLSSICVNVLELNQLSSSVVVCPRLEISTKIQRWHIAYTCQNVTSTLPGGLAPLRNSTSMQMMMMMLPMIMQPALPASTASPRPAVSGPANVPTATTRAPTLGASTMAPIAGMMMIGMRPASPPAAATPQRPPAVPAAPGATPQMLPAGMLVPRPADGLIYSLQPMFRHAPDDHSLNFTTQLNSSTNYTFQSREQDQLEQRSSNQNDTEPAILDNEKNAQFTTQSAGHQTMDHQVSTIDNTTESNKSTQRTGSSRILKRNKRQYDIFDVFHKSDRCDRAYRICITRSNNYIVSRLQTTRYNANNNNNCNRRPTKVVHLPQDNLCSYLTSTIVADPTSHGSSTSSTPSTLQDDDSLDAIIIQDDSVDDSNYPHTPAITPYNSHRIFPPRTPPQIAAQLQEYLKHFTNDSIILSSV